MANRTTSHGLTADIQKKMADGYSLDREREAREWITAVTGEELSSPVGPENLHLELKDGQILCKLINAIKPNSVRKINASKMGFKAQENISMFLSACQKEPINIPSHCTFQTVDLYENRNMLQVVNLLHFLGSAAKKAGYDGPEIGVKLADKNVRHFDQETLNQSKLHSSIMTGGTNKGANQAGMTSFGTQRKL